LKRAESGLQRSQLSRALNLADVRLTYERFRARNETSLFTTMKTKTEHLNLAPAADRPVFSVEHRTGVGYLQSIHHRQDTQSDVANPRGLTTVVVDSLGSPTLKTCELPPHQIKSITHQRSVRSPCAPNTRGDSCTEMWTYIHDVSEKSSTLLFLRYFGKKWTSLHNFFTVKFKKDLRRKLKLKLSPRLKFVATLPCEM